MDFVISCIFCSITIFSVGYFSHNFFFHNNKNEGSIYEAPLFGVIILSFLGLLINFFFPLSKFIGSSVIIASTIYFLKIIFSSKNRQDIIQIILFSSSISCILVFASYVNRPDAALYHLPYISLIHDSKIVVGASNIHWRFGIISNIQYLSGILNNHFFRLEYLTLPLASIFSFFIIFLYRIFNKLEKNILSLNLIFILIIISFYSFSRYSNYGNDAPSHIYFFLIILFYLFSDNNLNSSENNFFKISILSVYLFTLKPFMLFVLVIPFIIFIKSKKK